MELSKKAGLAQTGDNVQHNVSDICNCCPCCCGMMTAIRRFDIKNAIVSSNWISEIDLARAAWAGWPVRGRLPHRRIEIVVGEAEEGRGSRRAGPCVTPSSAWAAASVMAPATAARCI